MKTLWPTLLLCLTIAVAEPKYSLFWTRRGYPGDLANAMGEMRNAEQIAEKLRNSEHPAALFELGRLYFARGLYRQAMAFFHRTEFGGDARKLMLGLCYLILEQPDSAQFYFSQIQETRYRAWASAGLAKVNGTVPTSSLDYPYLANFFASASKKRFSSAGEQKPGYTLQFGAFSDSTRAQKLANKLREVGLNPYIQKVTIGGKTLYRVRAEHFTTRQEAEQAAAALGDEFIYMIVPEE